MVYQMIHRGVDIIKLSASILTRASFVSPMNLLIYEFNSRYNVNYLSSWLFRHLNDSLPWHSNSYIRNNYYYYTEINLQRCNDTLLCDSREEVDMFHRRGILVQAKRKFSTRRPWVIWNTIYTFKLFLKNTIPNSQHLYHHAFIRHIQATYFLF